MLRKFPSTVHHSPPEKRWSRPRTGSDPKLQPKAAEPFRSSVLGLQFWLRRSHFGPDGRLRVRCRAKIAGEFALNHTYILTCVLITCCILDVYFAETLTHVVGTVPPEQIQQDQHSRVMHATSNAAGGP